MVEHAALHDLSVQIGRLQADNDSAKSQRADTYERLERVEQHLSRATAILETLPEKIEKIGDKLDAHAKQDDERLTSLEHDRTRAKTTIRILGWTVTFLGAANLWALFKGAIFAAMK